MAALVATYHGPNHTFTFVNAVCQRYFLGLALPGRSLREVLLETEVLGVLALMDRVYQNSESSYQQELEVWLDHNGSGQSRQLFLNLLFHPLRDAQGRIDGLLDFSYDVTEQVLARRQVEQLNHVLEARVQVRTKELAAINEELTVTNEEMNQSNTQLTRTNVDLDTFYTASHDLKAPITTIESIGLALRDTLPRAVQQDEVVAHLLALLDTTVTRFRLTVDQLTDIWGSCFKRAILHAKPFGSTLSKRGAQKPT